MSIDKKNDLIERTIIILEKTKKYISKYSNERNILYGYFKNQENLVEWARFLEEFEKKINN